MNNQSYNFQLIFGRFLRVCRNYKAENSIRIHLNLFFYKGSKNSARHHCFGRRACFEPLNKPDFT
jgi:hypothetical protein